MNLGPADPWCNRSIITSCENDGLPDGLEKHFESVILPDSPYRMYKKIAEDACMLNDRVSSRMTNTNYLLHGGLTLPEAVLKGGLS